MHCWFRSCRYYNCQRTFKYESDILVLETGGNELEPEIEELVSKIDYSDEGLSYVLTTTRLRMLGGTTNIWSGCSAPFTELDMQNREWIPYSGWPIARKELDSYYIRAHELLPLGNYDYDADYHQKHTKKLIPLTERRNYSQTFPLFKSTLTIQRNCL